MKQVKDLNCDLRYGLLYHKNETIHKFDHKSWSPIVLRLNT